MAPMLDGIAELPQNMRGERKRGNIRSLCQVDELPDLIAKTPNRAFSPCLVVSFKEKSMTQSEAS